MSEEMREYLMPLLAHYPVYNEEVEQIIAAAHVKFGQPVAENPKAEFEVTKNNT